MNISDLSYFDYTYLALLLLFAIFFGFKGAIKSVSYSLKIILSISIPFIFYKRILNFSLEKLNIEYLFSLLESNSTFLEIISFIILFLITYIIYSILFYFSYVAVFKNYIDEKNRIMKLNISIFENLMYKDLEDKKEVIVNPSNKDKKNEKKVDLY